MRDGRLKKQPSELNFRVTSLSEKIKGTQIVPGLTLQERKKTHEKAFHQREYNDSK